MSHIIEYNIDIGQTKPDNFHRDDDYCPFCNTAHLKNILEKRGPMIWLENKYPVLKNTWQTLIIESDQCHADFSTYPPEYAVNLMRFGLEKWEETKQMSRFRSVIYYRNHGALSGGSIRHPHSQIVGFENYDYHEDIHPDHLKGLPVLTDRDIEINVSSHPIIGFFEFNLILRNRSQLPQFVLYMQRTAYFLIHRFAHYNESYNIFTYDFPQDDSLYIKMIPRFLTNPLYVGYMIPQISNITHTEKIIRRLRKILVSGKD